MVSQDFTVQSKNKTTCIQQNKHLGKILFTKNDFAPFNIGETIQTPKKDINYYSGVIYCNLSIEDTYNTRIEGSYRFYVRYISLFSSLRLIYPHHPYW